MNHKLDIDRVKVLVLRLAEDTKSGAIEWEKVDVDENVTVPEKISIPLTAARKDYHFQAQIGDGLVVHLQLYGEHYFIWIENEEGERAHVDNELYKHEFIVERIIELDRAVRKTAKKELMERIDDYIGETAE